MLQNMFAPLKSLHFILIPSFGAFTPSPAQLCTIGFGSTLGGAGALERLASCNTKAHTAVQIKIYKGRKDRMEIAG